MKVELHCHTSRHSPCAVTSPLETLAKLSEAGYGAVYLTEHNAVWPDEELAGLQQVFPRMRIFPGIELSLGPDVSAHLLVLGTNDPCYLEMRDSKDAINAAADEGCLTVLAHPFRWDDADGPLNNGALPDAIELRTGNHDAAGAAKSRVVADRLGLPVVNAGDVHALAMVDRFWIETARPLDQARDIRDVILLGAYRNCQRP